MSTQPKLLDRVRDKLRYKQYSLRTEQAYIHWIKRFIYDREIVRAGDREDGRAGDGRGGRPKQRQGVRAGAGNRYG